MSRARSLAQPAGDHPRIVLSAFVIGAVIAVAALARSAPARTVEAWIGIRSAREPYTALSFAKPSQVGVRGVTYVGRQVRDRLRFTVADEEHRRERYRWTISFAPHGRRYRGVVNLVPGRSMTVQQRILLPCARLTRTRHAPRVQVRVRLAPTGESIDYWQVCGG
jgi:hypothetical protein